MSENSDVIVKSIENGENPCSVVISGDGFAIVGKGVLHKIEPGKGKKRRGKYKKVTPRMIEAAAILVTYRFKPLELMELFGLARRTAYELSKKAKAEIERLVAASEREYQERERIKEASLREYQEQERAQERISAASLREGWEGEPRSTEAEATMKEGYSLREVREFKQ